MRHKERKSVEVRKESILFTRDCCGLLTVKQASPVEALTMSFGAEYR